MENARDVLQKITDNIQKVIIGKRQTVELIVLALASGGHVLIEDIPGVGKTSLVSALARSISCSFRRIQFTPDILPSDITGFSVYNPKTGEFDFHPGAVMTNIVLADEINRTSPKTQASLLEIMEEAQVTVDSQTYLLEQPFMVLATQNPIEYAGTYPLPEAQIDRFIIRVSLGYPAFEDEKNIVLSEHKKQKEQLEPVCGADEILFVKEAAAKVYAEDSVIRYILSIVTATRKHPDIMLGASPRGSISLYKMCQSLALYKGRDYITPEDVKYLAPYVLSHRLILNHEARMSSKKADDIIGEILDKTAVPV